VKSTGEARTESTRTIRLERDGHGWRVVPSHAVVARARGVTFHNTSGEPVDLYLPAGTQGAVGDSEGRTIPVPVPVPAGARTRLRPAQAGYLPYAVWLTKSRVFARGGSEPIMIVK
jgi:hypothetical protein